MQFESFIDSGVVFPNVSASIDTIIGSCYDDETGVGYLVYGAIGFAPCAVMHWKAGVYTDITPTIAAFATAPTKYAALNDGVTAPFFVDGAYCGGIAGQKYVGLMLHFKYGGVGVTGMYMIVKEIDNADPTSWRVFFDTVGALGAVRPTGSVCLSATNRYLQAVSESGGSIVNAIIDLAAVIGGKYIALSPSFDLAHYIGGGATAVACAYDGENLIGIADNSRTFVRFDVNLLDPVTHWTYTSISTLPPSATAGSTIFTKWNNRWIAVDSDGNAYSTDNLYLNPWTLQFATTAGKYGNDLATSGIFLTYAIDPATIVYTVDGITYLTMSLASTAPFITSYVTGLGLSALLTAAAGGMDSKIYGTSGFITDTDFPDIGFPRSLSHGVVTDDAGMDVLYSPLKINSSGELRVTTGLETPRSKTIMLQYVNGVGTLPKSYDIRDVGQYNTLALSFQPLGCVGVSAFAWNLFPLMGFGYTAPPLLTVAPQSIFVPAAVATVDPILYPIIIGPTMGQFVNTYCGVLTNDMRLTLSSTTYGGAATVQFAQLNIYLTFTRA